MNRFDRSSIEKINTLNPKLISSAMKVYNRCQKEGVPIYIVWGSRNVHEQDLLYKFGRTIPGRILTMKRGGYSPHNYGLALDFCLIFNNETMLTWEDAAPREYWRKKWRKVISFFSDEGWESGWQSMDFEPGHVQNLLDNSMTELIRKYEEDKSRNSWR